MQQAQCGIRIWHWNGGNNMLKKSIFLIMMAISIQTIAAETYYLNAANTPENINKTIQASMNQVKQNIKDSKSIKFNTLYALDNNQKIIICGSFQTLLDKKPVRFIVSPEGTLVIEKNIKIKNDFAEAWTASCK
ncbi:MAG: hypothetical protein ACJA0H_001977 [Francisellaceae bacterium]